MTDQEVIDLLNKYEAGQCSAEEVRLLMSYYDQLDEHSPRPALDIPLQELQDRNLQRLRNRFMKTEKAPLKLSGKWWAAAAAVFLIAGFSYLWLRPDAAEQLYSYNKKHDVLPGSDKAVLTLADGRQVALDDAAAGTIAQQNGATIRKNSKGLLVYTISSTSSKELQYNTISTPLGGQYQLILPDGSEVYLNAGSSLKYPVRFAKNERYVELQGEGYFQVAHDPAHPFKVKAANQLVKVLGTHFNINAYADESQVTTTLAEGKVNVTLLKNNLPSDQQTDLKPMNRR